MSDGNWCAPVTISRPLGRGEAAELLKRIAELYGIAEDCDADAALGSFGQALIASWSADRGSARDLVKAAIHKFDLLSPG